jgi:hypothetical protein
VISLIYRSALFCATTTFSASLNLTTLEFTETNAVAVIERARLFVSSVSTGRITIGYLLSTLIDGVVCVGLSLNLDD